MPLDALVREKPHQLLRDVQKRRISRGSAQLDNMMNHLKLVIDDYLTDREAC